MNIYLVKICFTDLLYAKKSSKALICMPLYNIIQIIVVFHLSTQLYFFKKSTQLCANNINWYVKCPYYNFILVHIYYFYEKNLLLILKKLPIHARVHFWHIFFLLKPTYHFYSLTLTLFLKSTMLWTKWGFIVFNGLCLIKLTSCYKI